MKRLIVLCSMFVVISTLFMPKALAQEDLKDIKNSNALHFYLINGYAVSYKFKSSGQSSFKVNLDFGVDLSSNNTDENRTQNDTNFTREEREGNYQSYGITISPRYHFNFFDNKYASIYTGVGPYIGYNFSKSKSEGHSKYLNSSTYNDYKYTNTNTTNSYSLGISGLIGIEANVVNNIILFAETQLYAGKRWIDGDNVNEDRGSYSTWKNVSEFKSDTWDLTLQNIRIGLGIYF